MHNNRLLADYTGMRDFNPDDAEQVKEVVNKFTANGGTLDTTDYPATGTVVARGSVIKDGRRIVTTIQRNTYSEAVLAVILRLL